MRALLAAAALVWFTSGCAGLTNSERGGRAVGPKQLVRLKGAEGPPLYWLGRSFEGLPLTHAEWEGPGRAFLVYGTCQVEDPDGPFGPEGGSCSPPIQIQHLPNGFLGGNYERNPSCTRLRLHGVLAAVWDGVNIFTGKRIVKVYARTRAEELRAAKALRPINGRNAAWQPSPPEMRQVLSHCQSDSEGRSLTIRTHCGLLSARINGRLWLADPPLSDGSGNPPPGWGFNSTQGIWRELGNGRADFRARSGRVALFVLARRGERDPGEGCQ